MVKNLDCEELPFNYWSHIVIKDIISPRFRWFVEYSGIFQATDIDRCDKCMVEGIVTSSKPFQLLDMSPPELNCTLKRMGLNEISSTDFELMPLLDDSGKDLCCEHCSELDELSSD